MGVGKTLGEEHVKLRRVRSGGNFDISLMSTCGSGCGRIASILSDLDHVSIRLATHGVLMSSADVVIEKAKQFADDSGLDRNQKRSQARRETTAPVRSVLEAARHTLLTQLLSDSETAAAATVSERALKYLQARRIEWLAC